MDKFIEGLDRQFAKLHTDSRKLIEAISAELLYQQPRGKSDFFAASFGRRAHPAQARQLSSRRLAVLQPTFGTIRSSGLCPKLCRRRIKSRAILTKLKLLGSMASSHFKNDADLLKEIMAPSGYTQLLPLLLDTLAQAAHHHGRARATFEILRAEKSNQS